ncbi:MAG: DUF2185 domain-containing protein [Oscillospiraceae bacterium]|nr:DUF2185 domain-containing protein [Oscillospiraceae bacterium]
MAKWVTVRESVRRYARTSRETRIRRYLRAELRTSNKPDSDRYFYKGDEDEKYSTDPNNFHIFKLNTICNYDPDIIPYLHSPIGTHLIRNADGKFITDNGSSIHLEKQDR